MSNAFMTLDNDQYEIVLKIKENLEKNEDCLFKQELINNGILVENNLEEYYKFKLVKTLKRYDRSYLTLTIAPTSDCNFRCPYCFENNPKPLYMEDNTQKELIDFIQNYHDLKFLSITWYGGEPLLAFDRIESITNKIKKLNIRFMADIITNGYYLDENVINKLEELHVRTIHITLDGFSEMHNKRRLEKNGEDSFTRIINNISLMSKINPSTKIVIRVNVDKENMHEYNKLYSFLKEHYSNVISNIYPGFVKKTYGECSYAEKDLLSNEEQAQFVLEQYKQYNIIDNTHFLPNTNYTECLARCLNAYLVAPDGYLYKCWTDLGNTKESVGHVSNNEYKTNTLAKYLVGGDPFSDDTCKKCKFLPICGGGCPHMKLKNIFIHSKTDLCHISKNHIHEFIELYYERYSENNC